MMCYESPLWMKRIDRIKFNEWMNEWFPMPDGDWRNELRCECWIILRVPCIVRWMLYICAFTSVGPNGEIERLILKWLFRLAVAMILYKYAKIIEIHCLNTWKSWIGQVLHSPNATKSGRYSSASASPKSDCKESGDSSISVDEKLMANICQR